MTVDEMVEQALGRVGEIGGTYPSTRGPMYRRLGQRQRVLFAVAAKINPERFGTSATAALTAGEADLGDIVEPTPTPEMVQLVVVADPGTSGYAVGREVTIVTVEDQEAELPPRAFLRDGVLIGVGGDLDLITSVTIYYPRLPALVALDDDGETELELEAPWDALLEVDLAKWLLAKATQLSAETKAAAIAAFGEEEKLLMGEFSDHVASYTPTVSRFVPPRTLNNRES